MQKEKRKNSGLGRHPITKKALSPKESLLVAAKILFAKKGLTATSIRDIAELAKTNSSMISYYFNSKEKLYCECLADIGSRQLEMIQKLMPPPTDKSEIGFRIKIFAEHVFDLFIEDREAAIIVIREYDRVQSPGEAIFKNTFLQIYRIVVAFFSTAQKKGFISKDKDPLVQASLFFGALTGEMRMDHIKKRYFQRSIETPKYRQKVIAHLVDIFAH